MLTLDDFADIKEWVFANFAPDKWGRGVIEGQELLDFLQSRVNDRCLCPEWEGHAGECDRFGPDTNLECECH
jgi:hypothetical protein